jgi:hypothetical protein
MDNSTRTQGPSESVYDVPCCEPADRYSISDPGTYTSRPRGNNITFLVPYARTLIYQKSFFPGGIRIWNSLGTNHLTSRGGGYGFFLNKYSDFQCCWKKYSDFGGGKKNNLIYNLMLNYGKKNSRFARQKKINSNSCCPKKKFWTEKKIITPPCKLNGRSLTITSSHSSLYRLLQVPDPGHHHQTLDTGCF